MAALVMLAASAVHGAEAVNVTVTSARIGTLVDELALTGTLTAEQSASLSPRVSGLVASVHVDAGHHVKAGDVLVELDATMARLALAESEAAIAEGQARLAEAERLRREAQRLAKTQSVAATQLEASESAVKVSAAALARLEAQRRAQVETIARHTLIAPFDGVVTRKLTEAGEWIETGTAAIELVAIDRLRLDVQVPQERYHDIGEDTPVDVRLDALPEQTFRGRILTRVPVKDTGGGGVPRPLGQQDADAAQGRDRPPSGRHGQRVGDRGGRRRHAGARAADPDRPRGGAARGGAKRPGGQRTRRDARQRGAARGAARARGAR
jgi:multidrug efflux pump subunit AcrA (membrane-fusion protein)